MRCPQTRSKDPDFPDHVLCSKSSYLGPTYIDKKSCAGCSRTSDVTQDKVIK